MVGSDFDRHVLALLNCSEDYLAVLLQCQSQVHRKKHLKDKKQLCSKLLADVVSIRK